jgi:hypothetical protein
MCSRLVSFPSGMTMWLDCAPGGISRNRLVETFGLMLGVLQS